MKIIFSAILFLFVSNLAQTTYYVSTNGTDSSSCGASTSQCASINQVLDNYPGQSFTINIATGTYKTDPIALQRNAFVIFQGQGSTIAATWNGVFLTTTTTSGFEFHDVSIVLSGTGSAFAQAGGKNITVGFYDVILKYSGFTGDVIDINAGSLIVNNVTLANASFDGYFIWANESASSVLVSNSTFSNLVVGKSGGILSYDVSGGADVLVNKSTFQNITGYAGVTIWAKDSNQDISILFTQLTDIYTSIPVVYIANTFQATIYLRNVTWYNTSSDGIAGALEIDNPNDGKDHYINLETLNFAHDTGATVGGLSIAYSSFDMHNVVFTSNAGGVVNDLVVKTDTAESETYLYSITGSCSNSSQQRAEIIYAADSSKEDISEQIPSCRCLSEDYRDCRDEILKGILEAPTRPSDTQENRHD